MPREESLAARSIREEMEPQTLALQFIAALLLTGAAMLLGSILLPTVLALILSIALSPVVTRLERRGISTTLGSLACMLGVATLLGLALGLMSYQAGSLLQESDRYIRGVAKVASRVSAWMGGDRAMESLGFLHEAPAAGTGDPAGGETGAEATAGGGESGGVIRPGRSAAYWEGFVRRNLQTIGSWVVSGLGGLVGFLGGAIVFLAFLFYMLQTRADWMERLTLALSRLGLRPRRKGMDRTQREIEVFVGFVSLVAFCYMVVSTLAFWLIGLPNPLLWGILTGLLEFIPFFGPMIAGSLITLMALALGSLWQPLAVVALFVGLHLVEGYVITPMVYGSAVHIDPVTVLFGVLFFGWIWGPLGSMLAMPTMILLRGLIVMAPDTPALDALADLEDRKNEEKVESREPVAPG